MIRFTTNCLLFVSLDRQSPVIPAFAAEDGSGCGRDSRFCGGQLSSVVKTSWFIRSSSNTIASSTTTLVCSR